MIPAFSVMHMQRALVAHADYSGMLIEAYIIDNK
jgi:hypothetical protein